MIPATESTNESRRQEELEAAILARYLRSGNRNQGGESRLEPGSLSRGLDSLLVDFILSDRPQSLGDGTDRCDLVCHRRSRNQMHVEGRVGDWPAAGSH